MATVIAVNPRDIASMHRIGISLGAFEYIRMSRYAGSMWVKGFRLYSHRYCCGIFDTGYIPGERYHHIDVKA